MEIRLCKCSGRQGDRKIYEKLDIAKVNFTIENGLLFIVGCFLFRSFSCVVGKEGRVFADGENVAVNFSAKVFGNFIAYFVVNFWAKTWVSGEKDGLEREKKRRASTTCTARRVERREIAKKIKSR